MSTPSRQTNPSLWIALAATVGLISVVSCVGGAILLTRSASQAAGGQVEEVLRPTANVLTAVQELARLETTRFHIERVIDLRDRHQYLFGLAQGEDAILLVAAGDVIAGVDLARMRPEDVTVDPVTGAVRIVLPAAEVLSAGLDAERTFVYSRQTDLLAQRSHTLETRARRSAEQSIRAAAIEAGILDEAARGARASVSALVRALGHPEVTVLLQTDER